ncbi:hypothetical protein AB6A40_009030 [Gnathostoma spinigerum]|uniref:Gelsolin-like domain-containing protein n=1 Tax=Gnathostoma spinigerum TaxID=75299 RepID=A0ABD6ESN0_9BILA
MVVFEDSDWDTNEEFWAALGESYDPRVVTSGGSDDESDQIATKGPSLWKVSDASGRLQISKIADGNFKTSMLDPNDAFILDSGKEVFVWIGKQCTHNERTKAMSWAQEYLQKSGRPAWTQIVRVLQSAEPAIFTQWFGVWDMRTQQATPHFLPRLFQCSDRSGRLAVEEIARFTQQDLESDDVMILDALNTIFVWIGSGSSDAEKTHALTAAQTYLKMSAIPRQNVSTQVIFQGQETSEFKKHFPEWK